MEWIHRLLRIQGGCNDGDSYDGARLGTPDSGERRRPGILTVPTEMERSETERLKESIPLGDFGRFDDVVEAALFLTKSGRYITGETLVVDGGRQLK